MNTTNQADDLNVSTLSEADYDRLYEYRQAPSREDLYKPSKYHRTRRRKGSHGHSDPTARTALRRVMYSSTSEGY